MKLKNIIIPSIILSSLIGAVYDQTTTPNTQTDMNSTLCNSISFPANNFGFSSSPFGSCNGSSSSSSTSSSTSTSSSSSSGSSSSGSSSSGSSSSGSSSSGSSSSGSSSSTSSTTSSGGGFIDNYVTLDSKDVDGKSGFEYKVNYRQDIVKNIVDEANSKTIQAKEIKLSEGKTSQAKIEIPKNTNSVTLKAIVEVNKNSKIESTTLQAEDKVQITLSNDGGFNSKVTNEKIEAEVNVDANAEATAKIIVQKKVEVTIKSPKGAEIKQENSGRVTSKVKVEADTGDKINYKPIEVEMSAETTGNLITTANITNDNGKIVTFKLELPANVTSGNMELIKNESNSNIYSAIKSSFKTSTSFKITDKSKRAIIAGKNIEIVATSPLQQFEEKQYFNGMRTITLVSGSANVIEDGEEKKLIKGVEYELLPPNGTPYSSTLTKIYDGSYLNIREGWNLISNPIYKTLDISNSFKSATITYKYSDGWIKNPKTLARDEGLWVNYSAHVSERIEGDIYYSNFSNLNSGWNLLGVGRDVSLSELKSFSEIWAYDSKVKEWVKNPTIIYRGYGFWAK